MLKSIFEKLDQWVAEQNDEAKNQSFIPIQKSTFYVVGQSALLEANLDLDIAATVDVDALNNAGFSVLEKFGALLELEGLEYDRLSNEIWMSPETRYAELFQGKWISAFLALPEFIMLSEAKMNMQKNRALLREYIASEAPERFYELCQLHSVNLTDVLRD